MVIVVVSSGLQCIFDRGGIGSSNREHDDFFDRLPYSVNAQVAS